ncbi:hypothetical protein EVAR_33945_1 [Eumeta japonica]|uniref:Uncharacterized protein n=1 Tax=Eumeta variegata TaxID=151549 RepID=A0A4C1W004_EUMVA|nr:hypothetical protein EVAR_33945_1 [Eumeta japonica]
MTSADLLLKSSMHLLLLSSPGLCKKKKSRRSRLEKNAQPFPNAADATPRSTVAAPHLTSHVQPAKDYIMARFVSNTAPVRPLAYSLSGIRDGDRSGRSRCVRTADARGARDACRRDLWPARRSNICYTRGGGRAPNSLQFAAAP